MKTSHYLIGLLSLSACIAFATPSFADEGYKGQNSSEAQPAQRNNANSPAAVAQANKTEIYRHTGESMEYVGDYALHSVSSGHNTSLCPVCRK